MRLLILLSSWILICLAQEGDPDLALPMIELRDQVMEMPESDEGCFDHAADFYEFNLHTCMQHPSEAEAFFNFDESSLVKVDERVTVSYDAQLCDSTMPGCQATYKCRIHGDFRVCRANYMRRAFQRTFRMTCPEATWAYIFQTPRRKVVCMSIIHLANHYVALVNQGLDAEEDFKHNLYSYRASIALAVSVRALARIPREEPDTVRFWTTLTDTREIGSSVSPD